MIAPPARLPLLLATRTVQHLPPSRAVAFAAVAGFDGVEVWLEDIWAHDETPARIQAAAAERGVRLTCHAAAYDVNPTSFNPGIRAESRRQVRQSVEVAAELGAPVVTVHPGKTSASTDQADALWEAQCAVYAEAVEHARRLGVQVGAEHMEARKKYLVCLPAEVGRLLAAVPGLGYTLDLAHAHQTHLPVGESVAAYWAAAGPPLHVHLSDSGRKTHLPVGEGEANLRGGLRFLCDSGYAGLVALEGSVPCGGEAVAVRNLERTRALLAE